MATFSFFSNRSREVARLVEQGKGLIDEAAKEAFAFQVAQVFAPLIERQLSRAEQDDDLLIQSISSELQGLIVTLLPTDTYFVAHYQNVLKELIDACRWKRLLKTIPFEESARSSQQRQTDVLQRITHLANGPEPTPLRRLTRMLTETDQQAVAYRTLRAFLSCLYQEKQSIHTTELFWLHEGRVQLRNKLIREYLFEQIALRVYLLHSTDGAFFIEEAFIKVAHWVRSEVIRRAGSINPILEEAVKDIVSQIKVDFFRKCQRWQAEPETFYLDAKLTTYLYGFVKKNHAIDKLPGLRKEGVKVEEMPEEDPEQDNESFDDNNETYGTWNPSEDKENVSEQKSILRRCLDALSDKCRFIITRHFDNDFSDTVPFQTLAFELGESPKTVESRFYDCMDKLKKLALGAL